MPETIPILLLTFGALYTSHKLFTFWKAIGAIDHLPGYRVAFHDGSLVSILTRIPGIAPGFNYLFLDKYTTRYTKWDVTSMVSMLPNVVTSLAVADADTAKHILSDRTLFPKPIAQMKFLTFFGNNIGTVNGEEWKRHRKISAPTFSDRNNRLVWDETILIMESLFSDVWKNEDVVTVDHFVDLTLAIAIFVISVAGFGKKMSWLNDTIIPDGHKMTFKDSLHITCTDFIFKLLFPDWILDHGTRRMKNTRIAFDEMKVYMSEMIQDRRLSDKVERHDLLSALMNAHGDDLNDSYLSDSELMGSIYVYLLAGHETSAHTLGFLFALLALYPAEQDKLFEQITNSLPSSGAPTYDDMARLPYSIAVLYETMRLFPPGTKIAKYSAEDTVITIGNRYGEKKTIPVPKGTRVGINTVGIHYNPRYWDDPESFNPSRFLNPDWNRDAFLPFSAGPRSCLGRKFFETEAIAVMTMIVLRYKVTIKDEEKFSAESFEQRKERILKTRRILTLSPIRVPLTFTRRG